MGFFDEVAGGLLKNVFSGQDAQGGMLESIMAILKSSESGGAEGLLSTFNLEFEKSKCAKALLVET